MPTGFLAIRVNVLIFAPVRSFKGVLRAATTWFWGQLGQFQGSCVVWLITKRGDREGAWQGRYGSNFRGRAVGTTHSSRWGGISESATPHRVGWSKRWNRAACGRRLRRYGTGEVNCKARHPAYSCY